MSSISKLTAFLFLIAFSVSLPVAAQPVSGVGIFRPDRGFLPTGSYSVSDTESVSETNGAVNLSVPLAKLPPGRAGHSWGLSLIYNSNLYEVKTQLLNPPLLIATGAATVNALQASPTGGWRYSYAYQFEVDLRPVACSTNDNESFYPIRTNLVFPDGSSHALRLQGQNDLSAGGFYAYRPDGGRQCRAGLRRRNISSVAMLS